MRIQVFPAAVAVCAFALAAADAAARDTLVRVEGPVVHVDALSFGETLSHLFTRERIPRAEGERFVRTLRRHLDLRRLAAGQVVILYRSATPAGGEVLRAVALPLRRGRSVVAVREGGGRIRGGVYADEEAAAWIEVSGDAGGAAARAGTRRLQLQRGDNLIRVLLRAGATRDDADRAATGMMKHVNLRRLAVGEPVDVEFSTQGDKAVLEAVALPDRGRPANLRRDAFGVFRPVREVVAGDAALPPVAPDAVVVDEFGGVRARLPSRESESRVEAVFRRGDTLGHRLQEAGMSLAEIEDAVRAFSGEMKPAAIRIGQRLAYGIDGGLVSYFAVSDRRRPAVLVARTATGEWTAQRVDWPGLEAAAERVAGRAWPQGLETHRAAVQAERLQNALERIRFRSGDVLVSVLTGLGAQPGPAHAAAAAFGRVARADRIRPGQKLLAPRTDPDGPLAGFFLETQANRKRGVLVLRDPNGRYTATQTDTGRAEAQLAARSDRLQSEFAADSGSAPPPPPSPDPVRSESRLPDGPHVQRLRVEARSGDTIAAMLARAGAGPVEVDRAVRAISREFDPRTLDVGQVLRIAIGSGPDGSRRLEGLSVGLDPLRSVEAVLEDGAYATHRVERVFQVVLNRTVGTIDSSLHRAAGRARLPAPVLEQLVRVFSFDIDFQRDIRPGDEFEVMYEGQVIDGEMIDLGRIVYAALVVGGEKRALYHHEPAGLTPGYFDGEGRSAAKALMRTPIDGARISSRFGMRRHPILGFNRMHLGMDFAAPTGTPVYAAGDGVVERVGRYGAYGKYIRIRHNSEYKTAYAHLSRYADGLRRGTRVTQGQVIGRVGSTGRSTGPHLHYEVLYRNKQVNPQDIDLPSPVLLEGEDLAAFLRVRNWIDHAWNDFGPAMVRVSARPSDEEPAVN